MRKNIKYFIFTLFLVGVGASAHPVLAATDSDLNGLWEETVLDHEYDEDTKDIFYISKFRDKLLINAVNYPDFAVGQVKRNGSKLTFTMANFTDRNETYVLNYECQEIVRGKQLKCKFTNQNQEVEPEIIWKKQNIDREIQMQ